MKKNGFTLVELLGVIILVAILSGIAVVSVNSILYNSKQNLYKNYEKTLKGATENYLIENPSSIPGIPIFTNEIQYGKLKIPYDELLSKEYIEKFDDPNGGECSSSYVEVIRKENVSINYKFDYNVCLICKKGDDITYKSFDECDTSTTLFIINIDSGATFDDVSVDYQFNNLVRDDKDIQLTVYDEEGRVSKNETITTSSYSITLTGKQRLVFQNLKKETEIYGSIEYQCPDIVDPETGNVTIPLTNMGNFSVRMNKNFVTKTIINYNQCT